MSTPVDVAAVSSRLASAYLSDRNDGDALMRAMGDVRQLLHEVERLRADSGTALRGQLVLALMDAEQARQALAEATRKVDELRDTVDGLCAELERARAERDDACVELVNERGDAVAWLRSRSDIMGMPSGRAYRWADCIERGEHRRKGAE